MRQYFLNDKVLIIIEKTITIPNLLGKIIPLCPAKQHLNH